MARTREKIENNRTPRNNIAHKACTAKYCKAYIPATRTSWRKTAAATTTTITEKLNLDRHGNKLWKLTKAMNDEETRSSPVVIQEDQETVTGKKAANYFIDSHEQVSNIMIPKNRKQKVHDKIKNHQNDQDPPEYVNRPFNTKKFGATLKTLNDEKSPAPTKLPTRCWNALAPEPSPNSWESSITAG